MQGVSKNYIKALESANSVTGCTETENLTEALKFYDLYLTKRQAREKLTSKFVSISGIICSVLFGLAFLLVFLNLFFLSLDKKEFAIVSAKLSFLVDIAKPVSKYFSEVKTALIYSGVTLIALPMIAAIITKIVFLFIKPTYSADDKDFSNHKEATKMVAQKANKIWSEYSSNAYQNDNLYIVTRNIVSGLSVLAFLAIGYFVLEKMGVFKNTKNISMIIAVLVCAVVGFFIIKLLEYILMLPTTAIIRAMGKGKSIYSVSKELDKMWLEIDPEEAEKRRKEAEKARIEREARERAIALSKGTLIIHYHAPSSYSYNFSVTVHISGTTSRTMKLKEGRNAIELPKGDYSMYAVIYNDGSESASSTDRQYFTLRGGDTFETDLG